MNSSRASSVCCILSFAFLATACESGVPRTFRGHFEAGFETSSFTPCGGRESWWAEMSAPSALLDSALLAAQARAARLEIARMPSSSHPALDSAAAFATAGLARVELYVEVRARRSARGRFGHLGGYSRLLRIESVRGVGPWDPVMCD